MKNEKKSQILVNSCHYMRANFAFDDVIVLSDVSLNNWQQEALSYFDILINDSVKYQTIIVSFEIMRR